MVVVDVASTTSHPETVAVNRRRQICPFALPATGVQVAMTLFAVERGLQVEISLGSSCRAKRLDLAADEVEVVKKVSIELNVSICVDVLALP
jgi:hypothetical protein